MSDDDYVYDVEALQKTEYFTIVIGVISIFFPLSVVFILLYRYDKLVKGRSLIHYVLMIALADTMVSITVSMGFPRGGTTACAAQGFMIYFFSRLSWFFTGIMIIININVIIIIIIDIVIIRCIDHPTVFCYCV